MLAPVLDNILQLSEQTSCQNGRIGCQGTSNRQRLFPVACTEKPHYCWRKPLNDRFTFLL